MNTEEQQPIKRCPFAGTVPVGEQVDGGSAGSAIPPAALTFMIVSLSFLVYAFLRTSTKKTHRQSSKDKRQIAQAPSPTMYIGLDANISAGKSTALEIMRRLESDKSTLVIGLPEKVHVPFLRPSYENPKHWACIFQFAMHEQRYSDIRDAMNVPVESGQRRVVVHDRSLFGDTVFTIKQMLNGHMNEHWRTAYVAKVVSSWSQTLKNCDTRLVFLWVPWRTCVQRLRKRQTSDNSIDELNLKTIEYVNFYAMILLLLHDIAVTQIKAYVYNWNVALEDMDKEVASMYNRIVKDDKGELRSSVAVLRDSQEEKDAVVWNNPADMQPLESGVFTNLKSEYRMVHKESFMNKVVERLERKEPLVIKFDPQYSNTKSLYDAVRCIYAQQFTECLNV